VNGGGESCGCYTGMIAANPASVEKENNNEKENREEYNYKEECSASDFKISII
jgi:hypothetical protein